jgi:hypothetical protein
MAEQGDPTFGQLSMAFIAKIASGALLGLNGMLVAAFSWIFRRQIQRMDDLEQRVNELEKQVPTRQEMNDQFERLHQELQSGIRSVHDRMDKDLRDGHHGRDRGRNDDQE